MRIDLGKLYLMVAMIQVVAVAVPGISQGSQQSPRSDHELEASGEHNKLVGDKFPGNAQGKIKLRVKDSTLGYILNDIARQANLRVVYRDVGDALNMKKTVDISGLSSAAAFERVLEGTGLSYTLTSDNVVGIRRIREVEQPVKQETGKIVGQVVDSASGKGIDGVTVMVGGSRFSVTTAGGGKFVIADVPNGSYKLSAKLLGYGQKSVPVTVNNKSTSVTIQLTASATSLNEVVTTATGKQRRVDISNDVIKINADKLMQAAPVRSVTDLLQAAQVNGVIVSPSSGEPGAPKRIRIGGVGSISQNNDPVVIVDGVWIKSEFSTREIQSQLGASSGSPGSYLSSRLDAIDPSTIETIEVVRGPSAATLYGPDAANGVILITTKRGKVGPARWDLQYSHDRKAPSGTFPQKYKGFGHTEFSTQSRTCTASEVRSRICIQDSITSWSDGDPLLINERVGFANQLSATVSGGTKQVTYSLSAGLTDERGTRKPNDILFGRARLLSLPFENRHVYPSELRNRRISTRLDISPKDGLDFSLSLEGSQQNSREDQMNLTFHSLTLLDTINVLNSSGSGDFLNQGAGTTRGLVSLATRWTPYSWVFLNSTLGVDKEVQTESRSNSGYVCGFGICRQNNVSGVQSAGRNTSIYTIRANSSFTPTLGVVDRFLSIRPGISFDLRRRVNYSHIATTTSYIDSSLTSGSFIDGPTAALGGLSVNANIRLFDRISFDPAIRHDFSGAKELENNSKSYPRFGTSWLVSDEPFFPQSTWLSTLRLRGAFGYASVQPNLSQLYGRYVRRNVNLIGVNQPGFVIDGVGNPHLQPERSSEFEVGFDADLLDERLMLTLTYSNKQNTNTLINRQLAPSAGAGSGTRQENIAKVVNHSTMIQTVLRPFERNNFRLRVSSNYTFPFNEIKSLGSGVSPFGTYEQRYVAGYPVGGLWNLPIVGLYDTNKNGAFDWNEIVSADSLAYMGSNMPRYTMGHNVEIGFLGNFTFNAFIDYKGPYTQNRTIDMVNMRAYWDVNISNEEYLAYSLVSYLRKNRDLQTVKELRLQSASISMNVPVTYVKRLKVQSINVSLQGRNLGLWSSYRGRDPALNSSPIGEMLTDAGNAIGLTRDYSLQIRVRY